MTNERTGKTKNGCGLGEGDQVASVEVVEEIAEVGFESGGRVFVVGMEAGEEGGEGDWGREVTPNGGTGFA